MDSSDDFDRQEDLLARKLARLLAGKPASLQGAVLADLTATWLKGATERYREDLLALQVEAIRALLTMSS